MAELARLEAVLDAPEVTRCIEGIEVSLPVGARRRQLSVRTLLLGMLLCCSEHRPAHLVRVHQSLLGLEEHHRWRLGVLVGFRAGPHLLSYRQVERTHRLVVKVLNKRHPDGQPSALLASIIDALLEASVEERWKKASSSLAVDWSDIESFSRPASVQAGSCADADASWGHRRRAGPGQKDELFFGYYFQLATMVEDEDGDDLPELARRLHVSSCHVDPPRAFVGVLKAMADKGIALGDVLFDSGYSHRVASAWALPLRALGASLVMDLHPHDRGPQGTHFGAVITNGSLYCPATPRALLELGPLARSATTEEIVAHDDLVAELAHYRLGRTSKDDPEGYHRVMCPAVMGKLRCPLRGASMSLSYDRPEISSPPEHPPMCCTQKTLTIAPQVASKTAQKHPYPSPQQRRSYGRRAAAERTNSTVKDPATTDISRGWCRLMGLTPISLFLACALVVRNARVTDSFDQRRAENTARIAAGMEPKTRKKRRRTLSDLVGVAAT